jgi:hypothetical protein
MMVSFIVGLLPNNILADFMFNYVQMPIETTLLAILSFSLVYALVRLLQKRLSPFTVLFLIVVVLALVGSMPLFGISFPTLGEGFKPFSLKLWASAGARGLLLGVGLGTIATGLRILMGVDRPYSGR